MPVTYLICFIAGILLGVRLLFFGAERRRLRAGAFPLRRSEPAIVALLMMFGLAGYALTRSGRLGAGYTVLAALVVAGAFALIVTRVAIATARITPEVDPEDPRFSLQGCVAVVTVTIAAGSLGEIRFDDRGSGRTLQARNIGDGDIAAGDEVCIERVEDGVAMVERWSLVEERL